MLRGIGEPEDRLLGRRHARVVQHDHIGAAALAAVAGVARRMQRVDEGGIRLEDHRASPRAARVGDDLVVGGVDRRETAIGGAAQLGRHARRGQLVGVMLAHQRAMAKLQLGVGNVRVHAEDRVRAARVVDEAGAHAEELAAAEAELLGDDGEERVLVGMQHAVGGGDVEQAFEQRAQHLRLVGEQARDLAGVDFVAGDVLRGEVEQAAEIRLLLRRDVEHAREGAFLDRQRDAVGLGHLGGQRRHRDGEGDGAISRRARCRGITRQPRPQTGQRIAHRAAARLDADRPCYCIPCHGQFLIGILGQHEEAEPEVAPYFGKVAANAGNFGRALRRRGRAVDAFRNAR